MNSKLFDLVNTERLQAPHVMLTPQEVVTIWDNLLTQGGAAALHDIPVPLVNFAHFQSDLYENMKDLYMSQLSNNSLFLSQVFIMLDLVCPSDDFAMGDAKERAACVGFAMVDNLPVLEYLWKQGFNWDERTLLTAVRAHSLECFKFAMEQGCPLDSLTFTEFVRFVRHFGTPEMLQFLNKE